VKVSVNFASREYIIARKVYVTLLVGAVLLAGLFAYQYSMYSASRENLDGLEAGLGKADALEADTMARYRKISEGISKEEINKTIKEAGFANGVLGSKSFSWTLFLNRLEGLIPKGVGVTNVSPDFNTMYVSISGSADDMGKLLEFMDSLTKSEYFEDLPPSFSTSRQVVDKDTGKTVEVFNIKIKYFPEGSGTEDKG